MSGDQPEVAALAAARIRRQPEPPLTLDEFEREIMASDAPLVRPVARDLMRALLRVLSVCGSRSANAPSRHFRCRRNSGRLRRLARERIVAQIEAIGPLPRNCPPVICPVLSAAMASEARLAESISAGEE